MWSLVRGLLWFYSFSAGGFQPRFHSMQEPGAHIVQSTVLSAIGPCGIRLSLPLSPREENPPDLSS